jgi:putative ABC transport system permease protein
VHATLAGEFLEQMPDMQSMDVMMGGISFLAIAVGGVGVLNAMLMAVYERTREIGVLRALGWRRRSILGMILREALYLGLLGGFAGIGLAFGLTYLIQITPMVGSLFTPLWELDIFIRAISVAILLGVIGGLYPAYRATRLQPVEALRYE